MSLTRLVYYGAVVGGWAALVAWLVAECLWIDRAGVAPLWQAVATAALVGGLVAAGQGAVAESANPHWWRRVDLLAASFLTGTLAGACGGLLGSVLYANLTLAMARALGWMLMGLGIGAAEGVLRRSRRTLRNGLIGGGAGGLVGGAMFEFIASAGGSMFGRACGLVLTGTAIGALVSLAHVVLKDAWLTVVDGFRPGRQLLLDRQVTLLGRGDHLPLPFLGHCDHALDNEHMRIERGADGRFTAADNGSRLGTKLNGRPLLEPTLLADGDLLRLGTNIVRFQQRARRSAESPPSSDNPYSIPPPPPPPQVLAPPATVARGATPPPLPSGVVPPPLPGGKSEPVVAGEPPPLPSGVVPPPLPPQ